MEEMEPERLGDVPKVTSANLEGSTIHSLDRRPLTGSVPSHAVAEGGWGGTQGCAGVGWGALLCA